MERVGLAQRGVINDRKDVLLLVVVVARDDATAWSKVVVSPLCLS